MNKSRNTTTANSSIVRDSSTETQSNLQPPDSPTKALISLATKLDQRSFKSLLPKSNPGSRETMPPTKSQMCLETTLTTTIQLTALMEHRKSTGTRRTGRVMSSREHRTLKAKDKSLAKQVPVRRVSLETQWKRMLMPERLTSQLPSAPKRALELQFGMKLLITKERIENFTETRHTLPLLVRTTDNSNQLK